MIGSLVKSGRGFASAFLADRRGNTTVIFASVASALFAAVGLAVDYSYLVTQQSRLQQVADAAAVAGANEMYIAQADAPRIKAVAKSIAASTLSASTVFKLDATADDKQGIVQVAMAQPVNLAFGQILGLSSTTVEVTAEARVIGSGRICVIGLDPAAQRTVSLERNAILNAPTCSVFSNSTSSAGLASKDGARLVAEFTCTAGGMDGSRGNFTPEPLTDCPAIPDPLSKRPAPAVGACDHTDYAIVSGAHVLMPGTYCGGLTVEGTASVILKPGTYVFKNGPLTVAGSAQLRGKYVGFYFTGVDATLLFTRGTTIDLSAPKTGDMAGLLVFQDSAATGASSFRITSDNARNLLGTIYLPNGELVVDANDNVASESAYTAIVTRALRLSAGPVLHLNTDYSATDIPVPAGVGPVGGNVILTR